MADGRQKCRSMTVIAAPQASEHGAIVTVNFVE
jgi:hypothetical protein